MKKLSIAVLLAVVLMALMVPAAFAQPEEGCPSGFELHSVGEHDDHDHHIGSSVDVNDDGKVCVKHTRSGKHVHVDNVIP